MAISLSIVSLHVLLSAARACRTACTVASARLASGMPCLLRRASMQRGIGGYAMGVSGNRAGNCLVFTINAMVASFSAYVIENRQLCFTRIYPADFRYTFVRITNQYIFLFCFQALFLMHAQPACRESSHD
jgi:hypothetical protein